MPVEIAILSGSRQGERIDLDRASFRVGDDPADDIYFDASRDVGARQRTAVFTLTDEGWTVQSAGIGEVLINQEPLSGKRRLRSGDVVRMSDRGPDLAFTILARMPATTPPRDARIAAATAPREMTANPVSVPRVPAGVEMGGRSLATAAPRAIVWRPHVMLIAALAAGGLALAGVVLVVAAIFWNWSSTPQVDQPVATLYEGDEGGGVVPAAAGPPSVAPATPSEQAAVTVPADPVQETAVPTVPAEPEPPPQPAARPWEAVETALHPAIWLLQVEHATNGRRWPFGTATAIGDKTLLTAATAAVELEKFRQQKFRIYAVRPALSDRPERNVEVKGSRVYVGFARSAEKPEQVPYFDLALLSVSEAVPETAPLAAPAELAALEPGLPIAWYGFGHDGQVITKFQSYAPQLVGDRVFLLTALDPQAPGSPRGLHFKAPLPANGFGGPVVNEAGHIVAVYSSSTDPGAYQGLTVHTATVIVPTLIQPWLEGRDEGHWVPPTLPPPASAAPPTPAPTKP